MQTKRTRASFALAPAQTLVADVDRFWYQNLSMPRLARTGAGGARAATRNTKREKFPHQNIAHLTALQFQSFANNRFQYQPKSTTRHSQETPSASIALSLEQTSWQILIDSGTKIYQCPDGAGAGGLQGGSASKQRCENSPTNISHRLWCSRFECFANQTRH